MEQTMQWKKLEASGQPPPKIKNHTAIIYKRKLFIFGGYDGKKNHNTLHILDFDTQQWIQPSVLNKELPQGRNGHTATLVENKMWILGGWLGQGPYASGDLQVLDLDQLKWEKPTTYGEPPGPCNMHTTDHVDNQLYVFRGGDGRDYLNDLHVLNLLSYNWYKPEFIGKLPPPRANHSSCVIGKIIYIFGGWDGHRRLNDLYTFNTEKNLWQKLDSEGIQPSPRAGMSLSNIKNKLYLFGGSGHSATCFNDLNCFNPESKQWEYVGYLPEEAPQARAGHSATVNHSKLLVFGGSYGHNYFQDLYVLDTDPQPQFIKKELNSGFHIIQEQLKNYINNPDLSDVEFLVDGKIFYAHKVIVSLLSEKFKAMFISPMLESQSKQIIITDVRYPVFCSIMRFLYTGEVTLDTEGQESSLEYLIDFLRVADQFVIDPMKNECERLISELVNNENIGQIKELAESYNASQLLNFCEWYSR